MSPRTRRAALYAIAAIAIAASSNALAHSYAGLYAWAVHHRLTGWQAMSWPAEIDVFLAVGELALYVAYLDGWPVRQRVWPWITALAGLSVSVAGNIGHIRPEPGHPVLLADRLTAAISPLAAFAGLTVGLLVLRMNRQRAASASMDEDDSVPCRDQSSSRADTGSGLIIDESPLLRDAACIYQTAATQGERLSQRALAKAPRPGPPVPQSEPACHRRRNRYGYGTELGFCLGVKAVDQISVMVDGLEKSLTLPELLDVGFRAFEFIRIIARVCERQTSGLLPAFMMAAGSAVEGRNALGDAPSFPPGSGRQPLEEPVGSDHDLASVADQLAALAERLHRRLAEATAEAGAGDRAACERAARAAADIHQLLARDL